MKKSLMGNIFKFPRLYQLKIKLTKCLFFILKQFLAREKIKNQEEFLLSNCRNGMKIIDIGCGHGWIYEFLSSKFKKIEYIGVDPFPQMISYCQKKYPQAKWLVGDLETLTFPDNYFDLGVFFGVIHHISTDEKVEKSIKKSVEISKRVIIRDSVQSNYQPLKFVKSIVWRIYDDGRRYYTVKELNEIYGKNNIEKIKEFVSYPMQQRYLALIKTRRKIK